MGQYQGTSGAAPAAAGRLRRPRGPPYENPGVGKGLIDFIVYTLEVQSAHSNTVYAVQYY